MQKADRQIAFVCTGNTCRSPMAEGIFNKRAKEKGLAVHASSFGLAAIRGAKASPNAVAVCAEAGVDISGHLSHFIFDFDIADFEKIYCMSSEHAEILTQSVGLPPERVEVLGVTDPYGGGLEVYRMCRDVIAACVEEILLNYED